MAFDLVRVLRALLFASPGSISVKDIQAVFTRFHDENTGPSRNGTSAAGEDSEESGSDDASESGTENVSEATDVPSLVTASQIRDGMETIRTQLEASNEVFRLQETHLGWRFVTSADCADWVRLFRNQPKPVKLSHSAMETLAIIAYRQPVVRSEIESIRGVSVDSALNRLLERDLVRIIGRADLPGRPIQYGTTDAFLEFVGVTSLEELPASDVLSAREIDTWLKRHEEAHPVSDDQVGLDTESGDEQADLDFDRENGEAKTDAAESQTESVDTDSTSRIQSPDAAETDDEAAPPPTP